ncbi:hypothetical protein [Kribbella albertanoniae]|uniref:Cyclase n=1 Tax=Kribbella albertanoniae TaxID=1266829 RepID=A0A4R4PXN5_9ACTN|nr:hypothetical protein [Kribbella albertanoniae]TDC27244.1 hypothetical protein E1261_20905 [Kribbella albertanoniae]
MITLHIENTIGDYATWKAAFDRYDRARRDHNVLGYRITRPATDSTKVFIDLDFAAGTDAAAFIQLLEKIWQTPRSHAASAEHAVPEVREVLEERRTGGGQ